MKEETKGAGGAGSNRGVKKQKKGIGF